MIKLFIVGFPRDMSELKLLELFSAYGSVGDVKIIRDQQTQESKGYGFISMDDQQGAQRAITAINGMDLDGRTLTVRISEEKPSNSNEQPAQLRANKNARPGKRPRI